MRSSVVDLRFNCFNYYQSNFPVRSNLPSNWLCVFTLLCCYPASLVFLRGGLGA